MRSGLLEGPVLLGEIPPVPGHYIPRQETGLDAAGLPAGQTTVLVPAEDQAPGLAGLGGTGKTALASALAHAHRDRGVARLVLWITATSRDAVISGYAQALRELGTAGHASETPERSAIRLLDWLAETGQPWLAVLDDLADPAVAEGLWPSGAAGRVVVTARQPGTAAAAHRPRLVRVGAFSPREALAWLSAKLEVDPGQRAGALDLATDLGFGPAALGLAGAFIAETGLDCRQYRARFAERSPAMAPAFPGGFSAAIAAAWSLSAELADQLAPRGMAGRALALLSLLTPHGIPGMVLASHAARAYLAGSAGAPADGAQVRSALRNLAGAGLIAVDDRSLARTVVVHEIVQVLTRQYVPAQEREQVARAAADSLGQAWSAQDLAPPVAQALRDCTARLHEIAGAFLWAPQCHPVLLRAGQSLDAEGLAGPAAAYWQRMLGISQHMLGAQHPRTAGIRDLLSTAYEASGNLDGAIAIHETALRDAERARGPGHPDTAKAGERLVRACLAAGRWDEAIRLAQRALAGRERAVGPDHPDTLTVQADLARAYLGAGRPGEAITALQRVVAARERLLGPGHASTIAACARLIDAYTRSGRLKEAIGLGKRTLANTERGPGASHPETTAARASLASAYRAAKKLKEALRLYERVLADREEQQGPEHPDTIVARSDLALALLATRKMGLAIEQYERALADAGRVLGHDHPITGALRESLQEAAAYARYELHIDLRSTGRPGSRELLPARQHEPRLPRRCAGAAPGQCGRAIRPGGRRERHHVVEVRERLLQVEHDRRRVRRGH